MESNSEVLYQGKSQIITLPDLTKVSIRETNGEDEGIISNVSNSLDGTALNQFVAGVSTEVKEDGSLGKRLTTTEVLAWPRKNLYYTLFKTRILSLGEILSFNHTCSNPQCGKVTKYEDNLLDYDNDMINPTEGEYKIMPYPQAAIKTVSLTTSSSKQLRYSVVDGLLEKASLAKPQDSLNKNSSILDRNLEMWDGKEWVLVTQFRAFSSKEMAEIRASIQKTDKAWDCISVVTCPACKTTDYLPIFSIPDFFFPTGI